MTAFLLKIYGPMKFNGAEFLVIYLGTSETCCCICNNLSKRFVDMEQFLYFGIIGDIFIDSFHLFWMMMQRTVFKLFEQCLVMELNIFWDKYMSSL